MEVVKAEPVIDDSSDDETLYQYTIELIEVNKLLLSVFNVQTGITFKTYIHKDDEWFKSNIYIFHGDFNKALTILQNSLLRDVSNLPHTEKEKNEELMITINYEDDMYPFQLQISVPKFISKNGPLDDRINALEYQGTKLKKKLKAARGDTDWIRLGLRCAASLESVSNTDTIESVQLYNSVGNLVYKGEMKNGKRHGKGVQYCEDSELVLYEGDFRDGYYDGEGALHHYAGGSQCCGNACSTRYKGTFCIGLKHGIVYSENGCHDWSQSAINTYNMGVLDGRQESYTKNIHQVIYKNNEHTYKDGLMHGPYITYDDTGKQTRLSTYIDGVVQH